MDKNPYDVNTQYTEWQLWENNRDTTPTNWAVVGQDFVPDGKGGFNWQQFATPDTLNQVTNLIYAIKGQPNPAATSTQAMQLQQMQLQQQQQQQQTKTYMIVGFTVLIILGIFFYVKK